MTIQPKISAIQFQPKEKTAKARFERKELYEKAVVQLVCASVALEFGVSTRKMLRSIKGDAHTCFTRQISIYLAHVIFQLRIVDVAQAFARDRTTITHACHAIEDYREDPKFDEQLMKLEAFLAASPVCT